VHQKRGVWRRRLVALTLMAVVVVGVAALVAQKIDRLVGVDERGATVEEIEIDSRAVATGMTAPRGTDAFGATRLWIDGGDTDPFRPGIGAFTAALRDNGVRISAHRWPGGHEGGYWSEHWRDYARFYAGALARC
jgi:acetyl esterase/lipase